MNELQYSSEIQFTNDIIPLSGLPTFEGIETNGLSKNYKKILWWNMSIGTILTSIFLLIIGYITLGYDWKVLLFLIPPILWIVVRILTFDITFRRKQYALREHDVVYRSGWLFENTTIIPYNRIQHISLHEGWIARRYGLANIKLYTTGDDLEIPGIPKQVAQKIQQLILSKIEKQPQEKVDTPVDQISEDAPLD